MFRMISLLKRKSGLTHQQFRDYYETKHRPIGEKAVEGYALSYERYYLYPMTSDGAAPIYDAMTQLCFPNRDAYDRCISVLMKKPEKAKMIIEDEQSFFDRETSPTFEAQDSFSKLQALPPSDTIFRTIWFARHRPGMTHEQCRDYYENKHRFVGEYVMNGYAYNYDRHFLCKITPDAPKPYYTFIMEMNFPSRARYEEMAANIVGDRTITQFIAEDEGRFIDRARAVHYTAEVSASVLAPLALDPPA
jgi:hypothetical protein